MLDVNKENVSSESNEKKVDNQIENTPVKSEPSGEDKEAVAKAEAAVEKAPQEEEKVVEEAVVKDEVKETKQEEEKVVEEAVVKDEVKEVKQEEEKVVEEAVVKDEVKETKQEEEKVVDEAVVKDEVKEVKQEEEKVVEEAVVKDEVKEAKKEEEKVVDEAVVNGAVKETKKEEKKEVPHIDFSKMNLDQLVEAIYKLLNEFDIKEVKSQIEGMKIDFQKKFKSFLAEKKEEFIKAGGNEIDFYYSSTVKNKFDELIREYKRKRQQFYKDIEREQKENLEFRLQLIDELKGLIDNAEASTMYKNFRNLQDRWREIGQIPHTKYNDVWRTYHHHVERFYDLLHLNNDFRDLDFKHNFEEKSKLIAKAETLATNEDVNHAFKELQILHRMWKEDIGPVAREFREEVWHRFSEATKKIHSKRHEFQDKLEEKYKANVDLKLVVIEKIKGINIDASDSHKAWQDRIKQLESFRNDFFAIGRVPKSKNEEIWQLFRDSTKKFNAAKNNFYKGLKKDQGENLKKKLQLVDQAESLKDSDDWDIATEVYKKIQAEWKKIGHVPRKDSDKIWKRFKDACNHYFNRLHEKQNGIDKDQSELIDKKREFMEQLKSEVEKGKDLTLEYVEESLKEWRQIGVLPNKVKHIESKFYKVLDSAYKKLNIGKDEAIFLRFKSTIDGLMDHKNTRKLDSEQLFIRRKVDEITKEIKQLENNISFISNATKDNPLVKNVYRNIEEHKKSLEVWKKKISYMKKLEY